MAKDTFKSGAASPLAKSLLYLAQGMEHGIKQAVNRPETMDDQARAICTNILSHLQQLIKLGTAEEPLKEAKAPSPRGGEVKEPAVPTTSASHSQQYIARFETLLTEMRSSNRVREYSELGPIFDAARADFWPLVRCLLLFLRSEVATSWGERLDAAANAALERTPQELDHLPWEKDELLYPGLKSPWRSRGIFLTSRAELDHRLSAIKIHDNAFSLARIVSILLNFTANETPLFRYAYPVDRFGLRNDRQLYEDNLIQRFREVNELEGSDNIVKSLKARLDLDEVIHALIPTPLADTSSWWEQLQYRERRTLVDAFSRAKKAGANVSIQTLGGEYANALRFTRNEFDVRLDKEGSPGEVLACLRVYAIIENEVLLGRVAYR